MNEQLRLSEQASPALQALIDLLFISTGGYCPQHEVEASPEGGCWLCAADQQAHRAYKEAEVA